MNLRRLKHFVALAEERHFGKAAARVHLSQPAFSRSIQSLEQELKLTLVDRLANDVSLTEAGKFVLVKARHLLFEAQGVQLALDYYSEARLGELSFGVGPFPAAAVLGPIVSQIRTSHPNLQLRIEINNWQFLLERLRKENIEFFVADARSFVLTSEVDVTMLAKVNAGFFVSANHPLVNQSISIRDVSKYGIATTRLPTDIRTAVNQALELGSDQPLPIMLETDDFQLLRYVAINTTTVLGVTAAAVENEINAGLLVPLIIEDAPLLQLELGLVTLKHRSQSPAAQLVIDHIKHMYQS
jgi:DNA-binding transcriptional LysR family regulator